MRAPEDRHSSEPLSLGSGSSRCGAGVSIVRPPSRDVALIRNGVDLEWMRIEPSANAAIAVSFP